MGQAEGRHGSREKMELRMVTYQKDGWNYRNFLEAREKDNAEKMRGKMLEAQQF